MDRHHRPLRRRPRPPTARRSGSRTRAGPPGRVLRRLPRRLGRVRPRLAEEPHRVRCRPTRLVREREARRGEGAGAGGGEFSDRLAGPDGNRSRTPSLDRVYEIALTVAACLRSGTRVDVAWVVETDLAPAGGVPVDPSGALALTPGGGRVGSLLRRRPRPAARRAGPGARRARAPGHPAGRRPGGGGLRAGGRRHGDRGGRTRPGCCPSSSGTCSWSATRSRSSSSATATSSWQARLEDAEGHDAGFRVDDTEVTTTWRPVPTVVLAGGGPVLQALQQMTPLLGWRTHRANDPDTARGLVVGLGPLDSVVLAMHDVELAGPVLASALDGQAGYVAALGSRAMQQSPRDLAHRPRHRRPGADPHAGRARHRGGRPGGGGRRDPGPGHRGADQARPSRRTPRCASWRAVTDLQ